MKNDERKNEEKKIILTDHRDAIQNQIFQINEF